MRTQQGGNTMKLDTKAAPAGESRRLSQEEWHQSFLKFRAERDARIAAATDKRGASQYYDAAEDRMLFETLDLDTVYGMIEEELLDAANYLYMLHARGGPDFIVMLRQLHSMWETLDWNRRSARQEGEKT